MTWPLALAGAALLFSAYSARLSWREMQNYINGGSQ